MFKTTRILSCIILIILLVIYGCGIQTKSAKKLTIKEQLEVDAEKKAIKGDPLWKGSWWGAGGPSKVIAGPCERCLIADGENVNIDPDDLKNATVIFQNSIGASRDSLLFHYIHKDGQDEKGDWGWVSYCIAGGNPWEWAPQNITKCNAIMFDIKTVPPGNTMTFKFADTSKKETSEVNVNLYLPKGKLTSEWQRVVIPFSVIDGIDKINLTSWSSMCGAFQQQGDNKVYIDNVIFFEVAPEDLPEEIRPSLELKIMAQNPKKYLDENILFNWDKDVAGWESMEGEEYKETTKAVRWESIDNAKIDPEDKQGHGTGVLAVDATLLKTDYAKIAVNVKKETDWSQVKFVAYDVYMPSNGFKGFTAVPYVQSDFWAKWAQDDAAGKELIPGEWVTIQFIVPTMANLDAATIDGYGTWLWGSVDKDYTGPIYIDNWRIYSQPAKEKSLEEEKPASE